MGLVVASVGSVDASVSVSPAKVKNEKIAGEIEYEREPQ